MHRSLIKLLAGTVFLSMRVHVAVLCAIFLAFSTSSSFAAIGVAQTASLPISPDLTVVETPTTSGGVELQDNRQLTQTFQVTTGFTIDKFHIDTIATLTPGATFTVSLFTVSDVHAGAPNAVPTGTNLLMTTSAVIPATGSGSVLEFELTGEDEIYLPANTGSEGYALQFNRADGTSAFTWRLNQAGDGTSGGAIGTDQYTSGQAYGTPLGGGYTHGNSDYTLTFTAVPEPTPTILFSVNAATDLNGFDFGTGYGGGIADANSVVFDRAAAIMKGQTYLSTTYNAPAVYVAASRSEFTGNFGVGNHAGSGWRIRLNSDVSDGATFYSDNLFPVFNASFDAANDTLDASSIYVSDMAAISSGTIRFVVRAGGNWYISEPSPNLQTGALAGSLTTSFSIEALTANWYAYDPTVMPTTNGVADIGAAATPTFTAIDLIGFHLEVVAAAGGGIGTFSSCNFGVREFSAAGTAPGSVIADLDSTRRWLWESVPGGNNRAERRLRTDVIDHASTQLSRAGWWDYWNHWDDDASGTGDDVYCDTLVAQNPVLHYLREAELNAVEDIRNTVVTQGVVIWHMYNLGVIVKTPSRTFAMDLVMRDAPDLVDVLDFALVSHKHYDHTEGRFLNAMIAAGKPVITPGDYGVEAVAGAITVASGTTTFDSSDSAAFGDITIDYKIGDHGGTVSSADMGLCRINCGPSGNDFVILHTGDGGNMEQFPKDPKVDLFLFHVNVGMNAATAINYVQARTAVASHILEMGHEIGISNFRWPYSYGYDRISSLSQDQAIVLSWGERWEPFPLGDSDGNRLPDDWETEHFGATSVTVNGDSDNDGYSNNEEYIMGFDPNVQDHTPLMEQGRLPSGEIQILLNTQAAQGVGYAGKQRRYKIEHSTNLTDWVSIPGFDYILGDNTQKSYTIDTSKPDQPNGFYRAVVWIIE